jgi:GT2 family glycosyltransferase/tetratricopeptide (TPR) repeat protein/2-polyprenyl-3-methyl-5-hydroxy-6-metoxy-1,4-benzoquinol methylase
MSTSKSISKVALIFDDRARRETTGVYCRRALEKLVDVAHFLPGEHERIPRDSFDLYVNIDDGLQYHLPAELRPCAWWAIDTHLNFEWCLEKSRRFDAVFAAQRDGADRLRQEGITLASWLPLACDPEIHRKHDVPKQFDVAFVGNLLGGPRVELLALLRSRYPSTFIGQRYFDEMARTYSAAHTVFNRSIKSDVNMRVFEAVACGSLLLTNDLSENGQAALFEDGVHLATYREAEDLLDKLQFYLERDSVREKIAAAGRAEALAKHTYTHRMQRLLAEVESSRAITVVKPAVRELPDEIHARIAALAVDFPWPPAPPVVPLPKDHTGWLADGAASVLAGELGPATRLVVELGSWLGLSTRFIADHAPRAVVVAVDHWQGSREHQENPQWRAMLPTLYEAFLATNWAYRDRVIPLKMSVDEGLPVVAAHGLAPDLVYFDADHEHDAFLGSLECARRFFPDAVLVGDDYDQPSVARALAEFAARHGLTVEAAGAAWRAWKLVARKRSVTPRPDPASKGMIVHHDPTYFDHARPEVVSLVPASARRVLDIGCGAGRLGAAIKARQQAEVVGIEIDEPAAECARARLDRVLVGNIELVETNFPERSFDAIVCADVLEHLREPERVLVRARRWLAPDGWLIASIPNVRHHTVIRALLQGNWTYEPAGLLDRTHLRFFTRREIEKLFFRAGYGIDGLWSVTAPGDRAAAAGQSGSVRLGRLCIEGIPEQDAAEFYAYQYLVRARSEPAPDFGLTSIVIVTHNQLEYTRQCLDSIRLLTDEPYELILVDNASSDGTAEYVSSLDGVRLIPNETNRGFPAAANQGIALAAGSQVLLLNNDTIVTTSWMSRLLRALYSDPAIGLVGPCSNFVSGPQQVEVSYDGLPELDGFAWDWAKANEGARLEVNRLVGFCLLIRKEVIEMIGPLDERFGIGCFEDDDYCRRAIQAGYRAVIARGAFVHHFGGRTFMGTGIDVGDLMRENQRKFEEKWSGKGAKDAVPLLAGPEPSLRLPNPSAHGPFAVEVAKDGGLRLRRNGERPRLSLSMIVRDSARTLAACLESIRPWVDEMVVVDTGSLDDTPRIVERYGGRLFHFPWCDDFSAARNESLWHARGEWVFWMDSDDTIPADCGRKLRALVRRQIPPSVVGFVVQVHCPGPGEDGDPGSDLTVVDHVKLLRNRPDLRFDGRIHEQILPAIRRIGGEVAWTDLYVVHSGSDQSPEAQGKKRQRDLRLLELELAERPDHPFTLFNLGMTHVHGSRFSEAADYLRRAIARSGSDDSHLRKAFALLVYAEMRTGARDQALQTCRRGRAQFPHDVELRFREGVLLHEMGRLHEARRAYLDVLSNSEERHFTSVDRALAGFKAHQNLAVIATDLDDQVEAEREWRQVVSDAPGYRPGWRGLGETLIRQGRITDAEAIAEALMSQPALRLESLLLTSRAALANGDARRARELLDQADAEAPGDHTALERRCQLLFENGAPAEAEAALRALILRNPQDASAHHNLGTLMLRLERYEEAALSFRQALRHRADAPATYLHLGYALKETGRLEEAIAAWQQVLRLSPNHPAASEELRHAAGRAREAPVILAKT